MMLRKQNALVYGRDIMPKRDSHGDKSASSAPKKARFNDVRFVNYELSKEEREALKAMPLWSEDWSTWFLRACDDGYRFSIRFDDYSHAYACFMSTLREDSPNFNAILPGRGSEPIKALRQALYKHWALAECEWNHLDRALNDEIDD